MRCEQLAEAANERISTEAERINVRVSNLVGQMDLQRQTGGVQPQTGGPSIPPGYPSLLEQLRNNPLFNPSIRNRLPLLTTPMQD